MFCSSIEVVIWQTFEIADKIEAHLKWQTLGIGDKIEEKLIWQALGIGDKIEKKLILKPIEIWTVDKEDKLLFHIHSLRTKIYYVV